MKTTIKVKVYDIDWDSNWKWNNLPSSFSFKTDISDFIDEYGLETAKWEIEKSKNQIENLFDDFIGQKIDKKIDDKYSYCYLWLSYDIDYDSISL